MSDPCPCDQCFAYDLKELADRCGDLTHPKGPILEATGEIIDALREAADRIQSHYDEREE